MASGGRMEKSKYKVSIIIPHYNQKEYLKRLLPSIANQTFDDYEVIIIDDATPDRSVVEYIKTFVKDHGNMRLVENTENMRFIKTCNKGITLAKGEYICLLNADTEVKKSFVERNVEILDADGSIGALSCVIVDRDGDNWFTGGSFKGGLSVNLTDDFQGIRTVDWVAGTAAFYRREVFDSIGVFNENYRMYHEDIEFGLRLLAETDYKACMFAEKLVVHYLAPSLQKTELHYFLHRNNILILREYYPRYLPKVLLLYSREIARLLIDSMLKTRPKLFLIALSTLKGVCSGLVTRQRK